MKRLMLGIIALAVAAGAGEANAVVGHDYLTAYDKARGVRMKAGKYGTQIRLHTKSEAMSATVRTKSGKTVKRKVRYGESVSFCGKTYYVSRTGKRWIVAHEKAGHALVVRAHVAKRKYRVLCGKVPRRVAARMKSKKKTMKPKPPVQSDH